MCHAILTNNINNIKKKAKGVSILKCFHLLKKEDDVSLNLKLNMFNQEKYSVLLAL